MSICFIVRCCGNALQIKTMSKKKKSRDLKPDEPNPFLCNHSFLFLLSLCPILFIYVNEKLSKQEKKRKLTEQIMPWVYLCTKCMMGAELFLFHHRKLENTDLKKKICWEILFRHFQIELTKWIRFWNVRCGFNDKG